MGQGGIPFSFWGRQSSCPTYLPGKYTAEEIDQMVFVDGYIPVANDADFENIKRSSSNSMGFGTCWAGTYTTGPDKKYLQVTPFSRISGGFGPSLDSGGIYDGNWLLLTFDNLASSRPLFTLSTANTRTIRNLNVLATVEGGAQGSSILGVLQLGTIVEDSRFSGTVYQPSNNGRLAGVAGANGGIIRRCWSDVIVSSQAGTATNGYGTICGLNSGGLIEDCYSFGSVTGQRNVGGFCGRNINGGIIQRCYTNALPSGDATISGFCPQNTGSTITDCYWNTDIYPTSSFGSGQNTAALQGPTSNTGIYSAYSIPPWVFPGTPNYPYLSTTPP